MRVLQGIGAEQMRFLQPVVVYVIYVRVKENPRRPMSWSTTTEREKTSGYFIKVVRTQDRNWDPNFSTEWSSGEPLGLGLESQFHP